jgi:uncharacterized protein (DUF58 family)
MDDDARRVNRRLGLMAYVVLYGLTLLGVARAEPRLWGVPAWYVWAGLMLLLLVPLNMWFARKAWPHAREEEPRG